MSIDVTGFTPVTAPREVRYRPIADIRSILCWVKVRGILTVQMAGGIVVTNRLLIFIPLILLAGCQSTPQEPTLEEVKSVAERYRDVNVAIAAGYKTDNKCVTAEMLGFPASMGAMGLHYVRRDVLGLPDKPAGRVKGTGTHTDFRKPAMLVYEPQPDGSLELVAVENLVFALAWHGTVGSKEPPKFHGRTYPLLRDDPATKVDEAHGWDPHYEQHLWVLRDNPNGPYSPFNPEVTCRHHKPPAPAPQQSAH